jgi:DNA repair protein RecN (Recombination protein N)
MAKLRKAIHMLTILRIKNLALVTDLTLEWRPGYNVITGETGAGKSVLIGALSLVLGQRADRTLLRAGADTCTVEAAFDVKRLDGVIGEFLESNGLEGCEDGQLVLKRSFTASGANKQFINGSPTPLATLSQLGEFLVDIHGPHEHQSLLNPARQLDLLDEYAATSPERAQFVGLLERLQALQAEKAALIVDEKTYAQQLDMLRFQVHEISSARLQPGEDEAISGEYHRASNAARLLQLSQGALDLLGESEVSMLTQAGAVGRLLHDLHRLDPSGQALMSAHEEAVAQLHDLQGRLSKYADKLDIDPNRLAELEARLNVIQSLKKKYGATVAEVNAFGEEAQSRLRSLEQRDAELERLNAEVRQTESELWKAGRTLSARRNKAIPGLTKAVCRHLNELGFKQSRLEVTVTTAVPQENRPFARSGLDTVEFQFAPNPGEPPRPLRAIASSGELARVMLAIKTVLASEDRVPVLVFDEVDANVGGETANAVGEKMCQIARQRQVLCVTHLAQVAAPATTHFVASKSMRDGRTISEINRLAAGDRVTELARMLGGQSEAARKHAAALLKAKV